MVYTKFNSFVNNFSTKEIINQAVGKAIGALENYDFAKSNNSDILSNVYDSLKKSTQLKGKFYFNSHSAAEFNNLSDSELLTYLFHRYRYDVYPLEFTTDDYPPCLQVEITSVCNFRCVFCYQTDKNFTKKTNGHMGFMSLDTFKQIIDQSVGNIEFVTLASRGEPTIHPKFNEFVDYLSQKFLGLKINTNASVLTEEKCHSILGANFSTVVFSADAADEDQYSAMRVGGSLTKTLDNIKLFRNIQAKHYSESKTITRVSGVKISNEQSLEKMEKFWGNFVDQVAFVEYNPWENTYVQSPTGINTPCSDLWRRMFIWWDGKTNPCDVDYLSKLSVGKCSDFSINELWSGSDYEVLRKKHLSNLRHEIDPCTRCSVI
jgi:sulfatase maturation enzyme AslB (radical SAM superfamily)